MIPARRHPVTGEDAQAAQARYLLSEMLAQVAEISRKLEAAERRGPRDSTRGALLDRRIEAALRRDLYEAHRLIVALGRRFPELSTPEAARIQSHV